MELARKSGLLGGYLGCGMWITFSLRECISNALEFGAASAAVAAKNRLWHRLMGAFLLIPLAASAISGIAYRTGEAFDISEDTLDLLMSIHEGDWLGKEIKPFYILVLGLGLGLIIISGLLLFFRKNKSPR